MNRILLLLAGSWLISAADLPHVDLHAHIDDDANPANSFKPAEVVALGKKLDVRFGVLGEGGCGGDIHDDATLAAFIRNLSGFPLWRGLQVYGFDWKNCLSKQNLDQLDYIAADALIFPDRDGKRVRLWLKGVQFADRQDFMDRYVEFNERVISQPIQVWANPTYLPESMQADYDKLWTPGRMDRLIAAAVRNGVAIEINAHFQIPSAAFIRRAKAAGAKFSIGSNRHGKGIGEIEWCLRTARDCGLTDKDIFVPQRELNGARQANDPRGLEEFRNRGLGLFIHWSVDGTLGGVISHSLVGASPDYVERYFSVLPKHFSPDRFEPEKWASLAKLAGFEYVMFTAKHHNGFCMWNTATTPFHVAGRDLTRDLIDAFRKQGIAIGIYFSPDDFWWLHQHGIRINRHVKGVYPQEIPEFMDYTRRQLRELLTNYGPIDYFFFDGPAEQLTTYAWELQPKLIITRGVMETPEQYIPGVPLQGAWEGNLTMGTEWPWKPTNEEYKSGTQLIDILIETRAKGGNLLLNIGPKPDGEIPIEQESRMREIALWNFVNGESVKGVRPWIITNENNVWFTRTANGNTVYAFLTKMHPWKLGEPKGITLRSVRATPSTEISVLGQSDEIVEYRPEVTPKTTWKQDAAGLHITAYRAQRLYTDRRWPNPLVLKITDVEPGLTPPEVKTAAVEYDAAKHSATLRGVVVNLGKADDVEVGFQIREKKGGTDLSERTEPWTDLPGVTLTAPGEFDSVAPVVPDRPYEYRARVRHPLITIYGEEKTFRTAK